MEENQIKDEVLTYVSNESDGFVDELRFSVMNGVVQNKKKLSAAELGYCKRYYDSLFNKNDKNHNSLIEYDELISLVRSESWQTDEKQAKLYFSIMDHDNNNKIDKNEWESMISELLPLEIVVASGKHVNC